MSEKNHYLPVFYQKRWARNEGTVCWYSRPHKEAKVLRRLPVRIGFEIDLYTVPGVDTAAATYLEREFFKITDDLAAKALVLIEQGKLDQLDAKYKSAWARFVISLVFRTPEEIRTFFREVAIYVAHAEREYERNWEQNRLSGDPETFAEFKAMAPPNRYGRAGIRLIQNVIDSQLIGNKLIRMHWGVIDLHGSYSLLTCDRPIIMTNGLELPDAHIALPIGPRKIFVVAANLNLIYSLERDSDDFAKFVNDRIVRQARRFCIGTTDTHLAFFARRFGERLPSTPSETARLPTPEELDRMIASGALRNQ